jgi:hypothetical protein
VFIRARLAFKVASDFLNFSSINIFMERFKFQNLYFSVRNTNLIEDEQLAVWRLAIFSSKISNNVKTTNFFFL